MPLMHRPLVKSPRRQHLHLFGGAQQHGEVPIQVAAEQTQPQRALPQTQRHASGLHVLRQAAKDRKIKGKDLRRPRQHPDKLGKRDPISGDGRERDVLEGIWQVDSLPKESPGKRVLNSAMCNVPNIAM